MEIGTVIKFDGGIVAVVEAVHKECYEVSGSYGRYAFRALAFDEKSHNGIMGSRIESLEMWRAKRVFIGYIKVFPVLCCNYLSWKLRPRAKKDFDAACNLVYNLDKMLPKAPPGNEKEYRRHRRRK